MLLITVGMMAQENGTERYKIDYAETNREYVLMGINIEGADHYEDYMLVGFSGLTVGERVKMPGAKITNAVKKFWKQGFFADVKIYADSIIGDSLWITIALKQLPRVKKVNYYGLKKGEIEDIDPTVEIQKNRQLNADAIDRTKIAIKKYLAEVPLLLQVQAQKTLDLVFL